MFHCLRSHFLSAALHFFFLFLFLPSVSLAVAQLSVLPCHLCQTFEDLRSESERALRFGGVL